MPQRNVFEYQTEVLPRRFGDFWDYDTNPIYKVLEAKAACNMLDPCILLVGPPGCGKDAIAKILGCYSACMRLSSSSPAPCGRCRACRAVRMPRMYDCNKYSPVYVIDGANAKGRGRDVIDELYSIHQHTTSYCKSKLINAGDAARYWVVFINEAHHLLKSGRKALLTLLENWPGANVVMATTDLKDCGIIDDDDLANDPLLQTALTSTSVSIPPYFKTQDGLVKTAARIGLTLRPDAAEGIARKFNGVPRHCVKALVGAVPLCTDNCIDISAFKQGGIIA